MDSSPSSSPGSNPTTINIPNSAPKFGTLVPNRVFVGGISSTTTEAELHQLFSAFGNVKQTKIIQDRAGVSKGYGFVTFETEEEARRLQVEADNIMLKERKLNIAPAIKKQQTYCGRGYEMSQPIMNGGYYFSPSGTPYTYQNGMAMFTSETGQQALSLLQQLPGKAGAHSGHSTPSHFPLLYGQGHAAAAMFLPTGGHTAAQAAAMGSLQQQLQIQTATHMNTVAAAAVQTQSPSRESGTNGTREPPVHTAHTAQTSTSSSQPWRWTALGGTTSHTAANGQAATATCGTPQQQQAQQAAAVQAAALAHSSVAGQLAAQSTPAAQQHLAQTVNYAQGGNQFLAPFETFHYIPSVFSTGLGQVGHHPGFVIPDRQTNY